MSRDSVARSARWEISRRGYLPVLLLVSLGVLITWALFQEVSRLDGERVETAFAAAAHDRILVIQREFQSSLDAVEDIGSFVGASRQVRRGQYREFVQPVLKRDPSIRSLEWVPEVAAEERDAFVENAENSFPQFDIFALDGAAVALPPGGLHYPLLFAHPYQRGETPLGLDFASVPTEFSAIQRARDLRRIQITLSRVALSGTYICRYSSTRATTGTFSKSNRSLTNLAWEGCGAWPSADSGWPRSSIARFPT